LLSISLRLVEITSNKSKKLVILRFLFIFKKHYPLNIYYTGKKPLKKELMAKQLSEDNKKLKERLERV